MFRKWDIMCIFKILYNPGIMFVSLATSTWVQCDECEGWFHLVCVGLTPEDLLDHKDWYCSDCTELKKEVTNNYKYSIIVFLFFRLKGLGTYF